MSSEKISNSIPTAADEMEALCAGLIRAPQECQVPTMGSVESAVMAFDLEQRWKLANIRTQVRSTTQTPAKKKVISKKTKEGKPKTGSPTGVKFGGKEILTTGQQQLAEKLAQQQANSKKQ